MRWERLGRTVYSDGASDTRYVLKDGTTRIFNVMIESRKRPIPHANGEGCWMHTSYFVVRDGKDVKECWKLAEAKEYAEKIALGDFD